MEGFSIIVPDDVSFHSALTGSEEFESEQYRLSRAKALQRLREKRNEMRNEELKEYEMGYAQSQEGREKWKSSLKSKRELELKDAVSRTAVFKALQEYPEIFDKNGRAFIQAAWNEITPDNGKDRSFEMGESANPIINLVPALTDGDDDNLRYVPPDPAVTLGDQGLAPSIAVGIIGGVEAIRTPVTASYLRKTMAPSVRSHMSAASRPSSMQPVGMLSKYIQHRQSFTESLANEATERAAMPSSLPPVVSVETRPSLSPERGTGGEGNGALIDSLLLIGPNKKEVDDFVEKICEELSAQESTSNAGVASNVPCDSSYVHLSSSGAWGGGGQNTPSAAPSGRARSISNTSVGVVSAITKQSRHISPDAIFITSHDPNVDLFALTRFSFPSGVETTVSVTPCNPLMMGPVPTPNRSSLRSGSKRAMSTGDTSSHTHTSMSSAHLSASTPTAGPCSRSVFLLTNHHRSQYGICLSVPRVIFSTVRDKAFAIKTYYSLCIISPYPFFSFFFHALAEFINMKGLLLDSSGIVDKQEPGDPIKAELRQLESFAMKLLRQIVPKPGKTLDFDVTVNMAHREVQLKRLGLQDFDEECCIGTLQWALPILLKHIPIDQILLVLGCALTEMRIIVRCSNLETLSACVLGLVYLLRPLRWSGPIITILPGIMHDYLESPVPMFFGVEATPKTFTMTNGLIVVDPSQKLIHMHPSDVVSSHTLCLPLGSKLQQTLKPIADNILKLSRKLRKFKRRSSSASSRGESNRGEKSGLSTRSSSMGPVENALDSDNDSENGDIHEGKGDGANRDSSQQLPSRKDLSRRSEAQDEIVDDPFASSPLLTAAITNFSNTVKTHMQTLINTAVQISWEKKIQKEQAVRDLKNAPREIAVERSNSDLSIASIGEYSSVPNMFLPEPEPVSPKMVFPRQTIGVSAFSFISMFTQTQMFSDYCQRHSSTNEAIGDLVTHSNENQDEEKHQGGDESVAGSLETAGTDGDIANNFDPLVMLFSIMLNGTCALSEKKLTSLRANYSNLYKNCDHVTPEDRDKILSTFRSLDPVQDNTRSSGVDSISKEESSSKHKPFTEPDLSESVVPFEYSSDASDMEFINEGDLWCNGRCNGLANTPSCTSICIDIWEARVQNLKKQKRAINIIREDSTILAPGKHIRNEDGNFVSIPSAVRLSNGKSLKVNSVRGIQPRKHPKETPSQYLHRVSLVTGRDHEAVAADEEIVSAILGAAEKHLDGHESPGKQKYHNPREFLEKTHSFSYIERSRQNSHGSGKSKKSKALQAIVASRQRRKKLTMYKRRVHAAKVLLRFFRRAQQYRIDLIRSYAATVIQKYVRGGIVRCNMDAIIATLFLRKQEALRKKREKKARGVLKNWIQRSFDSKRDSGSFNESSEDADVATSQAPLTDPVEAELVKQSKREVIRTSSSGAMKVFDAVADSSSEDMSQRLSRRDRAQSEDAYYRSHSLRPTKSEDDEMPTTERLRRANTTQLSPSSAANSHKKGLLYGLIPAKPPEAAAVEDSPENRLRSRGSFNITEALRRREALASDESDAINMDKLYSLSTSVGDEGYDSSEEIYSPAKPLSDMGEEASSGAITSAADSKAKRRDLKHLSEGLSDSDRKLGSALGLGPIVEETTRGHRSNLSDSTVSMDSFSEDYKELPLCIRNLGASGQDLLNHVQQQCIVDMFNILHPGILVLKHGRSGKPKLRTLCCDDSLSVLYWREVGQIVNDDRSTQSGDAQGNFQLPDMPPFSSSFLDQSNPKKSVSRRRSSFSVFSKLDSRREVVLRDVLEVRDDMTTDVMKRSIHKRYVEAHRNPSLVISIILKDRTLDFEIEELHWGPVYMALQILIDFFQVRLQGQDRS